MTNSDYCHYECSTKSRANQRRKGKEKRFSNSKRDRGGAAVHRESRRHGDGYCVKTKKSAAPPRHPIHLAPRLKAIRMQTTRSSDDQKEQCPEPPPTTTTAVSNTDCERRGRVRKRRLSPPPRPTVEGRQRRLSPPPMPPAPAHDCTATLLQAPRLFHLKNRG